MSVHSPDVLLAMQLLSVSPAGRHYLKDHSKGLRRRFYTLWARSGRIALLSVPEPSRGGHGTVFCQGNRIACPCNDTIGTY